MSDAPEDFENLRKLLKLKRYEQPPPGYFNNFSQRILARCENVRDSDRAELLSVDAPWVRRLLRVLETNPLFAGAFGVAICTMLIFGITSFQFVDRTSVAMMSDDGNAASPTLLTRTSSEGPIVSSINPRFSTNLANGASFGALSLSVQPDNNLQPVMFSPAH